MSATDDESPLEQPAHAGCLPSLVRPAWMIGSAECDWPEDASHENGSYYNKCVCCACDFIGHKRRHVCKRCHAEGEAHVAAMTPEERAAWEARRDAAIAEYLRANSQADRPNGSV